MAKASKKELKEDKLVKSVFSILVYIQEHSTVSMVIAGAIIVVSAVVIGMNYANKKANESALERFGIAQLAFRQGAIPEAKDTLQHIVDRYGRTDAGKLALYYLGYINLLEGNYDLALQNYEKFISSRLKDNDLNASALYGIGIAYEGKGDNKRAAETYEKLLNTYPDYFGAEDVNLAIARAYKASGDTSKAISYYENCLKKFPNSMRKEEIKENLLELTLRRGNGKTSK